jgi:hypothetical protein
MPLLGLEASAATGSPEMPHLHLPVDHTDADIVLAVNLAELVGSEDLYVVWSHESGPGAIPEVDAVLVHERPVSAFAEFFAALSAGFAGLWRTLLGRPGGAAVHSTQPADPPRRATA